MSAEIPYWWRVSTQIWGVLLIGHAAWEIWFNQSEALPRSGQWRVISMEFQRSFLRRHLAARETSGRVAKCQLFSQAREVAVRSSVTSCVRFQFVSWSSWSLKFVFSGPIRNLVSFGVLSYIQAITFIALEKCKKECDHKIWLKIFWCKVFCLLKMKITQFPNEFRLNFSFFKKILI